MALIYLSPSQQPWNKYADGYGSEQDQMTDLAYRVKNRLTGHEVVVLETGDYTTQVYACNNDLARRGIRPLNPNVFYLALHSDAGGGRGCTAFHNGDEDPRGRQLMQSVYDQVSAVTPPSDRGCVYGGQYFEVNSPRACGGLIEVSFHDNTADATWIRTHLDLLADAIARGIVAVAGGGTTQPTQPPGPDSTGGAWTYWTVDPGDTVSSIIRADGVPAGLTVDKIAAWNRHITDMNRIKPGDVLRLTPPPAGYPAGVWGWWDVDPGDTMSSIAQACQVSLDYLAAMNPQVQDINVITVGQRLRVNL